MLLALGAAFAFVMKVAIYALVTAVCGLFGIFFGFILLVHILAWWQAKPAAEEDIPFQSWRKRV